MNTTVTHLNSFIFYDSYYLEYDLPYLCDVGALFDDPITLMGSVDFRLALGVF